jgi:transcriptional regulator
MSHANVTLLQGTLDVMVLKALSWRALHGYEITRWLQDVTDDALRVEEGSLYPALHRLEQRGLVAGEWGLSQNNRRARYYTITAAGRRRLRSETGAWERFANVVGKVLAATAQPLPR